MDKNFFCFFFFLMLETGDFGCCGYLMARGSFNRSWSQRFVKLNGDVLAVASDDHFGSIKERIKIDKSVKMAISSPTILTLTLPNATSLSLSASSPPDIDEWRRRLQEAEGSKREFCRDSFDVVKTIAKSTFSEVQVARIWEDGRLVVIKEVTRKDLYDNEVMMLENLNHEFIIKMLFHFEFSGKYYIVLEYMESGDLFSRCEYETTKRDAKIYSAELLLALEYIHSKDIIYRDLKPENILLTDDGHIKLADFGFATNDASSGFAGTLEYSAPELLLNQGASKASDVWSFGVLLYELLYGERPFPYEDETALMHSIIHFDLEYPDDAEEDEKELLNAVLSKDPSKRPTFEQLKSFKYFECIQWDCLLQKMYQPDFQPEDIKDTEYSNGEGHLSRECRFDMSY